mmetsp:Transcript_25711/g.43319  ORF Transcript_25711/g.43319 Transcript_25711/m.43319 type:complete len:566 (-) Transcript_25711:49-1746(-)
MSFSSVIIFIKLGLSLQMAYQTDGLQVELANLGSSYTIYLNVGNNHSGSYIVDTSSDSVIVSLQKIISIQNDCQTLIYDQSVVNIFASNCSLQNSMVGIDESNITTGVLEAEVIEYGNSALHQWENASGIFGMGYSTCRGIDCVNQTTPTFQELLENNYQTTIFGLDFNNVSVSSFLDIGEIGSSFSDRLEWAPRQMSTFPQNYDFVMNDLSFCDVFVIANMSTTWQARVETGSACLKLPAEMYNNVLSWLDLTVKMENLDHNLSQTDLLHIIDMPEISFSLNEGGERMRVSLKDLLVDASELVDIPDAPEVFLTDGNDWTTSNLRMCMLPSSYVDRATSRSTPTDIVLGSLALRSLYVSVDISANNPRVGMANKRPPRVSKSDQCAAPVNCTGSQYLGIQENVCRNPDCRKYFYASLNSDTHVCEYDKGSIVVGILFIVIFATWEIFAFFVSQYTSYVLIPESSRKFSLDIVTLKVGSVLTKLVDKLIVDIFCWMPDNYASNGAASEPPQEDDVDMNADEDNFNVTDMFLNFDEAYENHLQEEYEDSDFLNRSIDREGNSGMTY